MDKISSLHRLSEVLQEIGTVLNTASELVADNSYEWTKEEINEVQNRLSTRNFYLGLLGEFKRGKSTLLNALTATDLIPTGVIPLTSIVTAVHFAEEPGADVILKNSARFAIDPREISEFVTEARNPKNQKNVERVEVFFPAEFLKDGLVLLDTPGVGSFYEHNTELTYRWLSRLDAALFLLSPDPPVSNSELEFLEEVLKYVPKVFVVLNKIDRLDEESLRQVIEFSRHVMKEKLNLQPEIYPISARDAVVSQIERNTELFEQSRLRYLKSEMEQFLMESKGEVFLRSVLLKTRRILEGLILSLKTEKEFAERPVLELRQQLKEVIRIREGLLSRTKEIQVLLRDQEHQMKKWLEDQLDAFEKQTISDLSRGLSAILGETHDFRKILFDWLRKELENRTFGKLEELETAIAERLKNELEAYISNFEEIAAKIIADLKKIIELPIRIDIPEPDFQKRGNFWLNIKDPLEHVTLSAYSFFTYLRKSISQGRLRAAYLESIELQTQGCAGKLRNELLSRIQESFKSSYKIFDQSVADALSAISTGLDRAIQLQGQDSATQIQVSRLLEKKISILQDGRERLSRYAS